MKIKALESGDNLWVMSMRGHTAIGSFSHVSYGEKLYRSKEACQKAIDEMDSWIAMGDRTKYVPLYLILA